MMEGNSGADEGAELTGNEPKGLHSQAPMDEQAYLAQRLQDQIDWYDRASTRARHWFTALRTLEIGAAAAIPFLAGYTETFFFAQPVVGLLGVFVAVVAGLLSLYQFQENWVTYRTTCEQLKQEKFLFLTKTEPYDGAQPLPLLVHRVESLVAKETIAWAQTVSSAGAPAANNQGSKSELGSPRSQAP